MYYRDRIVSTLLSIFVLFTFGMATSCSAQTEEQALKSLRDLSKDDKLPPEDIVAGIESRFAGRKTGALAKLCGIAMPHGTFPTAMLTFLQNLPNRSSRRRLLRAPR